MITATSAIVLAAAFVLGSIPFGYVLYRASTGADIRASGSGNIGATNVLRSGGTGLGVLTLVLDAGKGWLALWLALHFASGQASVVAGALVLVVVGHIFTPWLGFRGGKGVATGLGAFVALAPWALLAGVSVFAVVLATWRYVSLASVCACVALPLAFLANGTHPLALDAAVLAVAGLIIIRHHGNLARLRQGTERRMGAKA